MLRTSAPAARLWLAALIGLSCTDGVRLVVVEQGVAGSDMAPPGGTGGSETAGGSGGVSAGTSPEGGTAQPSAGHGGEESVAGAGGAPEEVPVWEAEPRFVASYVPYNFPELFMKAENALGLVGAVDLDSLASRNDATFEMTPGLSDASCVSFRSIVKAFSFLRHSGSRIRLNAAQDEPLFFQDATFCPETGLADERGVTFRSYNYDFRVIHLRNETELWIDDVPATDAPEYAAFAAAATFYRVDPLNQGGG